MGRGDGVFAWHGNIRIYHTTGWIFHRPSTHEAGIAVFGDMRGSDDWKSLNWTGIDTESDPTGRSPSDSQTQ